MQNVVLSNKFYDKHAVVQAIEDFREACDARILNDNIEVQIIPREGEDPGRIRDEFCNYVLGLMRSR